MAVTIGSRIDQLLSAGIVAAGSAANKLLEQCWPAGSGADLLAAAEAEHEVFEPLGEHPCLPDPAPGVRPPVAADAPTRTGTPPAGCGSGLSTADLSWAASIVGLHALDECDPAQFAALAALASRLRTAAAAVKNPK